MDTLNDRQKRFCDEYLVDSDATKAALRAGYSPKTARNACKWLNEGNPQKPSGKFNPEMRAYIDDRLAQLHSEKTADAQEVLEYLTSVMRGKHKEQTLVLCGDGMQEIEDIDVSARDRLKAAELIGKRYGILPMKATPSPLGKDRFLLKSPFDVHFFPEDEKDNAVMQAIAWQLWQALEFITLPDGDKLHGTSMSWEVQDGVLHFFVSFNMTLRRIDLPEKMGELHMEVNQ